MDYNFSSKSQLKNGLFLSFGLILILVSIVLLGGDKSLFTRYYTLHAKFTQVQGLAEGSVVSLSGINVGNVSKINFNPQEDVIDVELSIDVDFKEKITQGSKASVKTQGALGDKYIYISPGGFDQPPLKNNDYLSAEKNQDIFDVISQEGPKLANIVEVINELKNLLSNLNEDQKSAKLMTNLVTASSQLSSVLKESRTLIDDLRGKDQQTLKNSLEHLNNILVKIDKGEGSLGALINDPTLHDQILNMMGKRPRDSYLKPLIRATIKSRDEHKQ